MEKCARASQIAVLELLADISPKRMTRKDFAKLCAIFDNDENKLVANLIYLAEHEFIHAGDLSCGQIDISSLRIARYGIDLIMGDDGLASVKNTISVRFHAEALKEMENIIRAKCEDPKQRQSLLEKLQGLSREGLKVLYAKALELGLEEAWRLLL